MADTPVNPRDFQRWVSLAQVGMEMAAPIGVGLALDYFLGYAPWGVVGGAVVGLVGGLAHLVRLAHRPDESHPGKPPREHP
jgi:F0F1-type ATP synthase assembly protein I